MPVARLWLGDCIQRLRDFPDDSIDACVTDAPYGLGKEPPIKDVLWAWLLGDPYRPEGQGFMGNEWDAYVPGPEVWREVLRVLKPGGHLLSFFGTRTYDVGTLAIRLAGFEVRDQIDWLYGQGFPKSLDVSKAIDKAAGAEREIVGSKLDRPGYHLHGHDGGEAFGHGLSSSTYETRLKSSQITAPATPEAAEWEGWGTALKPGHEPICVARKPLAGTVEANVRRYGTGAINIEGCRAPWVSDDDRARGRPASFSKAHAGFDGKAFAIADRSHRDPIAEQASGRWPTNVVVDEEAAAMIDAQSEGASRYFPVFEWSEADFLYVPKASKKDRGEGNNHPTVKPIALMRWLVRLVTPSGGTVLDPFAGSGTTGVAAAAEGFDFLGIERDPKYFEIARRRLGLEVDHA